MAITYVPDAARLVEVSVQQETTYGTYKYDDMTQLAHNGVTWGRGHQQIEGQAAAGTTQHVITYRAIRGIDTPFVSLSVPFGFDNRAIVSELIAGNTLGAVTANQWDINDYPNSYSISVNAQRSGSASCWNFAGCYMRTASLNVTVGTEAECRLDMAATSLVDPQSATAHPADTPTVSAGPLVLRQVALKEDPTYASVDGTTAVKFRGCSINWTRGLIVEHTSEGCEPTAIVPTTLDVTGELQHNFSSDMWTVFQDLVAKESDGGFTTTYLQLLFTQSSNEHRIVMPVRLDVAQFDGSALDGAIPATISFTAAGDDATPTHDVTEIKDT